MRLGPSFRFCVDPGVSAIEPQTPAQDDEE
jgi:hypothetical protein